MFSSSMTLEVSVFAMIKITELIEERLDSLHRANNDQYRIEILEEINDLAACYKTLMENTLGN